MVATRDPNPKNPPMIVLLLLGSIGFLLAGLIYMKKEDHSVHRDFFNCMRSFDKPASTLLEENSRAKACSEDTGHVPEKDSWYNGQQVFEHERDFYIREGR